jgi:hypothetical protein
MYSSVVQRAVWAIHRQVVLEDANTHAEVNFHNDERLILVFREPYDYSVLCLLCRGPCGPSTGRWC